MIVSCGDDEVSCDNEAEINRILDEGADDVLDAIEAYSLDQSESNCNSLRTAYGNWIDELERLQGCADEVGQGDEFRSAINDSRDAISTLPCG